MGREPLTELDSLYWVFTHNCNLTCAHCYNWSRPGAPTVTRDEAMALIANLPPRIRRINLSGGEPLTEYPLLLELLGELRRRYPAARLQIQTNGDLLDDERFDALLDSGLGHIAIASEDHWHPMPEGKFDALRELFASRGMVEMPLGDPGDRKPPPPNARTFNIWGATPDFWVGGVWPRGRAYKLSLAKLTPEHNFCDRWSGALGFLDNGSSTQEIAVQLTTAYPCCPGTVEPLGDLTQESLAAMLARHEGDPIWEALNDGDPAAMGLAAGSAREHALRRIKELGSVCLWCDGFLRERLLAERGEHVVKLLPVMGEFGHPERG